MQKCSKCGIKKPLSEFYKNRGKPRKDCKTCHEQAKVKTKLGFYGLTETQYNQLLVAQQHKCLICDTSFISKKLTHIDHCHTTNKVRGILCHYCNTALGLFKESIPILKTAIKYISDNKTES